MPKGLTTVKKVEKVEKQASGYYSIEKVCGSIEQSRSTMITRVAIRTSDNQLVLDERHFVDKDKDGVAEQHTLKGITIELPMGDDAPVSAEDVIKYRIATLQDVLKALKTKKFTDAIAEAKAE